MKICDNCRFYKECNEYEYYSLCIKQIRADAIDEFIKMCDEHAKYDMKKHPQNAYCLSRLTLLKIAEQMKGGAENE